MRHAIVLGGQRWQAGDRGRAFHHVVQHIGHSYSCNHDNLSFTTFVFGIPTVACNTACGGAYAVPHDTGGRRTSDR
jgi:hypothetical protein